MCIPEGLKPNHSLSPSTEYTHVRIYVCIERIIESLTLERTTVII